MNEGHVPTPCMLCAWNSSNESPRSASHHEETPGKAVRNAARRIEYKHHLHAIGVRGSDPCTTTNSSELHVHVHASTQWQGLLT